MNLSVTALCLVKQQDLGYSVCQKCYLLMYLFNLNVGIVSVPPSYPHCQRFPPLPPELGLKLTILRDKYQL